MLLGDQRVPQTLGPAETYERHVKLGKGVPSERHNKGYTREHGGVKGGWGMRATGGGVSKTPALVSGWPHPLWPRPDGPRPWRLATPPLFVLSKWRR